MTKLSTHPARALKEQAPPKSPQQAAPPPSTPTPPNAETLSPVQELSSKQWKTQLLPLGPLQVALHLCPTLYSQRPPHWTHDSLVRERNSQDPEEPASQTAAPEKKLAPPHSLPSFSLELRANKEKKPRELQRVFSELEMMLGLWGGEEKRVSETVSKSYPEAVLETVLESTPKPVPGTVSETVSAPTPKPVPDTVSEAVSKSDSETAPEATSGSSSPPTAKPPDAAQHFSQLIAASCELRLQHQAETGMVAGSPESSDFSVIGSCLPTPAALSRALRFASQPVLLSQDLVLLHASSVCIEGQGHVFAAPSGTGKSTLARRLVRSGAELLGDEVALVGLGRVWVHPGQLEHGTLGKSAPLAAIHLLRQGPLKVQRLRPAQSLAELLSLCMSYIDGPRATQKLVDLMSGWLESCPVYESSVPNSEEALELLSLLGTAGIKA